MTTTLAKPRITRSPGLSRRLKYGKAFRAGIESFLKSINATGKLRFYEFTIETTVGILELNIHDTWVAGRFVGDERPAVARLRGEVNPYSGKFNHHYSVEVPVAVAVENFKRSLGRILPGKDDVLPAHYFRLKYRKPGDWPHHILAPGSAPQNSLAGILALLADWNKRDHGQWEWAADEIMPEEFDHPSRRK